MTDWYLDMEMTEAEILAASLDYIYILMKLSSNKKILNLLTYDGGVEYEDYGIMRSKDSMMILNVNLECYNGKERAHRNRSIDKKLMNLSDRTYLEYKNNFISFCCTLLHEGDFTVSILVIAVCYIEKFIYIYPGDFNYKTWSSIFMIALNLADKYLEDAYLSEHMYIVIYPFITRKQFGQIERLFLSAVNYDLNIAMNDFFILSMNLKRHYFNVETYNTVRYTAYGKYLDVRKFFPYHDADRDVLELNNSGDSNKVLISKIFHEALSVGMHNNESRNLLYESDNKNIKMNMNEILVQDYLTEDEYICNNIIEKYGDNDDIIIEKQETRDSLLDVVYARSPASFSNIKEKIKNSIKYIKQSIIKQNGIF